MAWSKPVELTDNYGAEIEISAEGKTRVVNIKHEPCDIYIGRPSFWGNPFEIGEHGTREEVIQKYREYFYKMIKGDPDFRKAVESLRGKALGCYCKPLPCHGDVIVEYLEEKANEKGCSRHERDATRTLLPKKSEMVKKPPNLPVAKHDVSPS